MKKTKLVKKQVKEEIIVNILCNLCGQSCAVNNRGGNWNEKTKNFIPKYDEALNDFYGLIEQELHGGYYSTHLDDGWIYRFSLCEGCIKGLMDRFKIPVEIKSEYSGDFLSEPKHKKRMVRAIKATERACDKMKTKEKKA